MNVSIENIPPQKNDETALPNTRNPQPPVSVPVSVSVTTPSGRPVSLSPELGTRGVKRIKFLFGEFSLGSVSLPALNLASPNPQIPPTAQTGPAPVTLGSKPMAHSAIPPLPEPMTFPDGVGVITANSHPIGKPLPRLTILPWAIRYTTLQYQRYYIVISGTFESYLMTRPGKIRHEMRRKVRKFTENSEKSIDFRSYPRADLQEFHLHAHAVSNLTYQSRLLNSGLPDWAGMARYMDDHEDACGFLLFRQNQPIAYMFCTAAEGRLAIEFIGYDPSYEKLSPGIVLQFVVLEKLFAEKTYALVDFTEGEGRHKSTFSNMSDFRADILYFDKTFRNSLVVGFLHALHMLSRGANGLLERLGLKERLKKRIRRSS